MAAVRFPGLSKRGLVVASVLKCSVLLTSLMGTRAAPHDCAPNIVHLETAERHSCVVQATGAVRCWGGNLKGELGLGDTITRGDSKFPGMGDNLPAVNLGTNRSAVSISTGHAFNCAILDNGTLKCWGDNMKGMCGIGKSSPGPYSAVGDTPGEMGDELPAVYLGKDRIPKHVSCGYRHTCVILEDGDVVCFGRNGECQLGRSENVEYCAQPLKQRCINLGDDADEMGDGLETLVTVNLGINRTALQISAGERHTCAVLDDKSIKCWGLAGKARLGLGDDFDVHLKFPTRGCRLMGEFLPAVDLGANAVRVAAGSEHTCALLEGGRVKCWGSNLSGRLGLGLNDTHVPMLGAAPAEMGANLPALDLGSNRTAVDICAGHGHSCAVLDNGMVKCWGEKSFGKLGNGQSHDQSDDAVGDDPGEMGESLAAVELGTNRYALKVKCGHQHTCALLDDYSVKCWGHALYGRLGGLGVGLGNDRWWVGFNASGMGDKLQPLIFSVCPCEEGSTSNGQKCVSCTEGKFKDSVGTGPCTDCPDNSTSPPGASDARDCVCNIGFTAGPENVTCLPCEHGTYKNTIGSNECTRCRAHNQNMLNEMTMDDDCKCRVGFTGPNGGPCTKCPAGTYKDHSGSSACKLCPANSSSVPGSYSAEHCLCESGYTLNGNSGCTMCLPGFTRDKNDLCVTCDAGKFKSGVGDDACTACPPYSHSAAGSPSEQACLCFVGSQSDGSGSCELCPAGKFKTEEGPGECTPCRAGTYSDGAGAIDCIQCDVDDICLEGSITPRPQHLSEYSLQMSILVQTTVENFDTAMQRAFKKGIAFAAKVPDSSVIITRVQEANPPPAARRVLAPFAEVEFFVYAKDPEQLQTALQSLQNDESVTKSLSSTGFPGAKVLKAPVITPSKYSPLSLHIGVSAALCFGSILCFAAIAGWRMRRRDLQIISTGVPYRVARYLLKPGDTCYQTDLPEQLRSSYIAEVCLGRGSFGIAIKVRMKQWTQDISAPGFSLVGYTGQRVVKMVQNGGYKLGDDQLRRLHRETKLLKMLNHEAVVRLYDSGSTPNEDLFWLIMQDCGGISLDHQLDAGRLFTEQVAVQIGTQVASGLDAIHKLGVVHRDIKPENVIECFRSDPSRAIKYQIIDLGVSIAFDQGTDTLATASAAGEIKVAGTPRYMSPEMLMRLQGREDGGEIGPTSDIWSLGATLVHLVAGRLPWESNLGALFAFARSTEPVVDIREIVQPQVSAELSDPFCQALTGALKRRIQDRFQSAKDFAAALRKSVGLRGVPLYSVFISYRAVSEKAHARLLYDALHGSMTQGGIPVTAYLDQRRLSDWEDLEDGWVEGLLNSAVFVPLISTTAYSSLAELKGDESDPYNNFLTEIMIALALKETFDDNSVRSPECATTGELISDSSEESPARDISACIPFGSHLREILPLYMDTLDAKNERRSYYRGFPRRLQFADKPSKRSTQAAVDFLAGQNFLGSDGVRCKEYLGNLTVKKCVESLQAFRRIDVVQRDRLKGTVLHPSQEMICSDFLAAHSRKKLERLKSEMEFVAQKIHMMIDAYARCEDNTDPKDSSDSRAQSSVFDFEKSSSVRRGFRCLPLLGSYFASGGRSSSPQGENPGRACEEPNSGSPHQPSPVPEKLEHLQESLAEGHALQPPLLPIPGPEEAALFPEEPAETFALRVGPEHERASRDGERDGIALDDVAPEMPSAQPDKCDTLQTLQMRDNDSTGDGEISETGDGGNAGALSDEKTLS